MKKQYFTYRDDIFDDIVVLREDFSVTEFRGLHTHLLDIESTWGMTKCLHPRDRHFCLN